MSTQPAEPFMFVSCKRVGADLHCTPWSYADSSLTARVTGEVEILRDALTVSIDPKGVEWVGIAEGTLARVCALVGAEPAGYALRWNSSATHLHLVVSGFLFCAL
jgi:hypothetical protein